MTIAAPLFSSKSEDWSTPPELFQRLDREFRFTLDAAATADNAKCANYYTKADDSLSIPWPGRVWLNPPYGRKIALWMEKAYSESTTHADIVVCLVPARTCTAWFHDWATRGELRFIRGRLRFGDSANAAPFPSLIVVFRRRHNTLIASTC